MFPEFVMIKQNYAAEKLENVDRSVVDSIKELDLDLSVLAGKKVGIAVGSRGISNIEVIVKAIVNVVKAHKGEPIIFAAMGSHGGSTLNGQKEILASLNIREENMGAEIRTATQSILLGTTAGGLKVYANELVSDFDYIILTNRIKPHTDFEDITESGILKLLAIGIGNHEGAKNIHANALRMGYGPAIREAGTYMLQKLPVLFSVAITENWRHDVNGIYGILPADLLEEEIRILDGVKKSMIKLPAHKIDTLIIEEAGKNISGTCVDTKVVGRIMIPGQKEPEYPNIKTIAVLDFTEESHGNAMGLGVVDIITKRAFYKIDVEATSLTGMTSTCLLQSKIPCVAPNDYEAIDVAFTSTGIADKSEIRGVYIKNTNSLECMAVTRNIYEEIKENSSIELIQDSFQLEFNEKGELKTMFK